MPKRFSQPQVKVWVSFAGVDIVRTFALSMITFHGKQRFGVELFLLKIIKAGDKRTSSEAVQVEIELGVLVVAPLLALGWEVSLHRS